MRAAACSLLDNALTHEGALARTHTHRHVLAHARTTASVATFPSEGCGHLQERAVSPLQDDQQLVQQTDGGAISHDLYIGRWLAGGKNSESTVLVQISGWEITPQPLRLAATAEASCPLQIRDSVCALFVLAGEAAGSADCCNAGTRPAHRLGNRSAPYSGGRFYLQGHLRFGSCQVLSPPPEVFSSSLMAVKGREREKERERVKEPLRLNKD